MMRIIPLDKKHIPQARQWINRLIEGEGLVYKPLEEDAFEGVFWRSLPQARRHTALLETEEGRIAGLASGVSMPLAGKAYISFIAVAAPPGLGDKAAGLAGGTAYEPARRAAGKVGDRIF